MTYTTDSKHSDSMKANIYTLDTIHNVSPVTPYINNTSCRICNNVEMQSIETDVFHASNCVCHTCDAIHINSHDSNCVCHTCNTIHINRMKYVEPYDIEKTNKQNTQDKNENNLIQIIIQL